jgi:hypothetical protein
MRSPSSDSAPRWMTCFLLGRAAQRVDAAEQRIHARDQVRQRQVLGQEIVGPSRRPDTASSSLSRA